MTKEVLGRWTTANIPHADNQNPFEHDTQRLLRDAATDSMDRHVGDQASMSDPL